MPREMSDWLRTHYEVLKDFAGPGATIVAALVAAAIAALFLLVQARIARTQRDIALDQLKSDLFAPRYKVYNAAKAVIEHISLRAGSEKVDILKVRELYITLDEARFYFDQEIVDFLNKLVELAEAHFTTLLMQENTPQDSPKWRAQGELMARQLETFGDVYAELPSTFERALRFSQLQ